MKSVIFQDKKILPSLLWRCLKWHFNYLFTKGPLPLACGVYITSKCNFKCSFCNIWRKPVAATLPLSKAKKIIDDLSGLGCFYLSITGGEPLLVEHLFDLLAYIRKSRIKYTHLVTNGYLLDKDRAVRLKAAGINEVSISIDADEQVHDANRGMPGAYRQAINAIENLKKYSPDTKIVLNAIFYPENPTQCLHAAELARRLDVYVKVQPLNQHPVFNSGNCASLPGKNISALPVKEAIERLREERRVVNSKIFLDNIYNFFCRKQDLIFRKSACLFGYHHIEILEDGRIFPCLEGLNWEKGIAVNGGLKGIIRSREYKRVLEELKTCKGCQHNYYICYYEPRIIFPINNFLRSLLNY